MLKKFLIGTFVALTLLVGATVSAADFGSTTLKVGSRGEAVKAVQTLVGASVDGVFGPMTKAKVIAWQSNNGLTADGLFGAKSKAKANGAVSGNFPAGCTSASGYSSTTGQACVAIPSTVAGCASGAAFSSTTGQACSGAAVVSSTGEGSATVTFDSTPINSTTVNRGENKAVMGIKVKATGSDMKVTRLWLDIGTRIWLSADTVTLLDGSTVISTLPLSPSTVTETTVGSAWRLEFNNLNFVVPVGTTKVLTVKVSRPTATSANTDVVVAVTSSLRAVDGAGITDTYAFTTLGTRTWDLADAATATGTLTNTLSASSPVAQSVSGLSTTAGTLTAVKLMDFDLKAKDGAVNVTDITGTITTAGTCTAAQCISSLELRDGTTVLDSVAGAGTFDFAEQDINIAADTTKTLSVWAKVNHIASSYYVVAGDSLTAAVTNVTGTSGPLYTAANATPDITGYAQHLFQYAPTFALVNTADYPTSAVSSNENTSTTLNTGGDYKLSFSVTAPAGNDIFINTPGFAVGQVNVPTKTTFGVGGTIVVSSAVSGATLKGSTLTTWDKIAAGQTRIFTLTAHIPHGGNAGYAGIKINTAATTGINWSAAETDATGIVQIWGVDDLKTGTVYITAN
ncbi:MAG: peptidoglycan-binding domain-containing protein [Candidatus Paceibacterota bacterium]|jgi:peptidoglycan hydrolase-like protein with peptidoglycan-binding domain